MQHGGGSGCGILVAIEIRSIAECSLQVFKPSHLAKSIGWLRRFVGGGDVKNFRRGTFSIECSAR